MVSPGLPGRPSKSRPIELILIIIDYIYAYSIVNNICGPNVALNFLPKSGFSSPTYTSATSERSFGIVSLGHLGSRLLRSYVSPRPPDPMPSGYLLPVAFMYV